LTLAAGGRRSVKPPPGTASGLEKTGFHVRDAPGNLAAGVAPAGAHPPPGNIQLGPQPVHPLPQVEIGSAFSAPLNDFYQVVILGIDHQGQPFWRRLHRLNHRR
jgi:hypothetical protein